MISMDGEMVMLMVTWLCHQAIRGVRALHRFATQVLIRHPRLRQNEWQRQSCHPLLFHSCIGQAASVSSSLESRSTNRRQCPARPNRPRIAYAVQLNALGLLGPKWASIPRQKYDPMPLRS